MMPLCTECGEFHSACYKNAWECAQKALAQERINYYKASNQLAQLMDVFGASTFDAALVAAKKLPKEVIKKEAIILDICVCGDQSCSGTTRSVHTARGFRQQTRERVESTEERWVPCGTFGCTVLRPEKAIMCANCREDYSTDPDAYK